MKFKFFPSALAKASLMLTLCFSSSIFLNAQTPTPTPSATPKPKVGHIRLWNALPPQANVELELVTPSAEPGGKVLASASSYNFYAAYINVLPGRYNLKIFRRGDRQNPLKTADLPLMDKGYITFIATQPTEGQINVDVVNDTPDYTQPAINRVTVRQFAPDTNVVVTASGTFKTDSLMYGSTQILEGMPNSPTSLSARATKTGSTSVRNWDSPADFRAAHHYTLFVINDLYGRMRTRVAVSGPSAQEEADAEAESKSTPKPAP